MTSPNKKNKIGSYGSLNSQHTKKMKAPSNTKPSTTKQQQYTKPWGLKYYRQAFNTRPISIGEALFRGADSRTSLLLLWHNQTWNWNTSNHLEKLNWIQIGETHHHTISYISTLKTMFVMLQTDIFLRYIINELLKNRCMQPIRWLNGWSVCAFWSEDRWALASTRGDHIVIM